MSGGYIPPAVSTVDIPTLSKRLREAVSAVTLNYGLRARCGAALNLPTDALSLEMLESREEGAGHAYMALLRVLATVDEGAAAEIAFITGASSPSARLRQVAHERCDRAGTEHFCEQFGCHTLLALADELAPATDAVARTAASQHEPSTRVSKSFSDLACVPRR